MILVRRAFDVPGLDINGLSDPYVVTTCQVCKLHLKQTSSPTGAMGEHVIWRAEGEQGSHMCLFVVLNFVGRPGADSHQMGHSPPGVDVLSPLGGGFINSMLVVCSAFTCDVFID